MQRAPTSPTPGDGTLCTPQQLAVCEVNLSISRRPRQVDLASTSRTARLTLALRATCPHPYPLCLSSCPCSTMCFSLYHIPTASSAPLVHSARAHSFARSRSHTLKLSHPHSFTSSLIHSLHASHHLWSGHRGLMPRHLFLVLCWSLGCPFGRGGLPSGLTHRRVLPFHDSPRSPLAMVSTSGLRSKLAELSAVV